jgi:hypothetical protein
MKHLKFYENFIFENENKLNFILDKISKNSINSLSPNELEFLKLYTTKIFQSEDFPELKFNYSYTKDNKHFGRIIYNNIEIDGFINISSDGEFLNAEFYDEINDLYSMFENDEYSIDDFFIYDVCYKLKDF